MPVQFNTAEEPIRAPLRLVQFPERPADPLGHASDRAEFLRAFENLGVAMLVCDSKGCLVHQTETLARMLEQEPEAELLQAELRRLAARGTLDQRLEVGTRRGRYLLRSSTVRASWTTGVWPVVSVERIARAACDEAALRARFDLTPAQCRVALLLVEGKSSKEIAAVLGISWCTVRRHTERIYMKVGVRSRAELVTKASSAV